MYECIDFLADGGVLGGVSREEFDGTTPTGECIRQCASRGGAFSLGGEIFQFLAMDQCVAGGADEERRRQFSGALSAGHY